MKKIIVSALAITGLALNSYGGPGCIFFDGSNNSNPSPTATSGGQVFINGVLDTDTDINTCLLMYNPNTSTYVSVVTLLLSQSTYTQTMVFGSTQPAAGDISYFSGGLYDASGNEYEENFVAGGNVGTFRVEGWTGNCSSYEEAFSAAEDGIPGVYVGITAPFTVVMLNVTQPPVTDIGSIKNMPALNLVPEPNTLALAGLGGLSLLLIRRRK